jgi:hypothetical protein
VTFVTFASYGMRDHTSMTPRAWAMLLVLLSPILLGAAIWDAVGPADWGKVFFYACETATVLALAASWWHERVPPAGRASGIVLIGLGLGTAGLAVIDRSGDGKLFAVLALVVIAFGARYLRRSLRSGARTAPHG